MGRRRKETPTADASVVTIAPAGTAVARVEPTLPPSPLPVLEHSPLGASSAERWMNCSGSVALIQAVRRSDWHREDDPDYRRDGIQAHALAAWCLNNEADCWEAPTTEFPELTAEMLDAVQTYLDFVRTLPGDRKVEYRIHRPEFHDLFYGTLDFATAERLADVIHIVDYKHGAGVCVEPHINPQLMYYAYGLVAEDAEYPDDTALKIHVVQPRYPHPDGPIRTWETTVGRVREWARSTLLPAMERTLHNRFLNVGEHCRFCPAKLVCPAMRSLATGLVEIEPATVAELANEVLGSLYEKWQRAKMLGKAVEEETQRRLMGAEDVPGVKLVAKRTNRVWKDGAPVGPKFLHEAWKPMELKGPAEIAKLPGGAEFVAEWAFSPEAGYTVALADDKREAVSVKSGAATFGAAVENLVNPPQGD